MFLVGEVVEAKNFFLYIGHLRGEGSQWCNRLPRRKGRMHMFKCIVLLLAVTALLVLALAVPAFAAPPNCHGTIVGGLAKNGITPPEVVDSPIGQIFGFENAGDYNKGVKRLCKFL
jgi:hypothetical protein